MSRGPSSGVSARLPPVVRRNRLRAKHYGQSVGPAPLTGTRFALPQLAVRRRREACSRSPGVPTRAGAARSSSKARSAGPGWAPPARPARPRGRRPRRLDLAAVTYVDAAGVQLLRDVMAEGVEIAAFVQRDKICQIGFTTTL